MAQLERSEDPVDDLASRLEFETLISDTSAALFAASPDAIEGAIERALAGLRRFFRADRCALLVVSPDQRVVNVRQASYSEGVEPVAPDINLAEVFPWSRQRLLVERAPVRISRISELPVDAHAERASWLALPIRSALTLPIEVHGDVSHLVVLNTVERECEWPDAFVTRLRTFAEMLVGALERQALVNGLRRAQARLASGAELAGLGFYEVRLEERVMFSDARLLDLAGVPPERTGGLGVLEFWMERIHPRDRARVLELRERMHAGEIERLSVEYAYQHPTRGELWVQHLAGVSVRDAARRAVVTYGVLRDVTAGKRADDEVRDLGRRLIQAQEQERALVARELHDDVTQRLAVLAIDAGRAELGSAAGEHAETMRALREGLARLSEDVHALAYQLHPSVLDELGLVEALRAECERIDRQSSVALSATLAPFTLDIDRDAALALFRVAQGALNNVVRHAGARAASVVLREMDGGLMLEVRDDGVGFDPARARRHRSLGLSSMHERLLLVTGTLEIDSTPGQGTSIIAWVPAAVAA